jgi:Rad52/22 family double-strand break repair protein
MPDTPTRTVDGTVVPSTAGPPEPTHAEAPWTQPYAPAPGQTRGLTFHQVRQLLAPIRPNRVFKVDQKKKELHVSAWDVRAQLSKVFGLANWDSEVLDLTMVYDVPTMTKGDPSRNKPALPAFDTCYRATVRLTIRDFAGNPLCVHSASATGSNIMPDFKHGDNHDFVIKTAESQALKRCAINLGQQFGLSLYKPLNPMGPVMTDTLVWPKIPMLTEGEHKDLQTDEEVGGDDVAPDPDEDVRVLDTADPATSPGVDPQWFTDMVKAAFGPDDAEFDEDHPYHGIVKPADRLAALWQHVLDRGQHLTGVELSAPDGTSIDAGELFDGATRIAQQGKRVVWDDTPVPPAEALAPGEVPGEPVSEAAGSDQPPERTNRPTAAKKATSKRAEKRAEPSPKRQKQPSEPDPQRSESEQRQAWLDELTWQARALERGVDEICVRRRNAESTEARPVEHAHELSTEGLQRVVQQVRSIATKYLREHGHEQQAAAYEAIVAQVAMAGVGLAVPKPDLPELPEAGQTT